MYQSNPDCLTFEVVSALIELNASLPRFLIQAAYRDKTLPEGSLERIAAHGYVLYGEALQLEPFHTLMVNGKPDNDADEFEASLLFQPDVTRLRKVLFDMNYIPALRPFDYYLEWDVFWRKVLVLFELDPEMALHLCKHSSWHILDVCSALMYQAW